jgi:short subunit dehydrogenase-like uncharacterized protein
LSEPSHWLLYGANGYTGRLIAEEAATRGMRPILAGRNRQAVEAAATELGCESRIFALDQVDQIAENLAGTAAVLHCAGPFSATAEPMMDACLAVGAHYLDITGEINVIEAAAARHDQARQAGVSLIPAVGMDVVPTDCLAAMLAQRLPGATHLQLAVSGLTRISPGTARTVLEGLAGGGRVRIDGRITKVPLAWKTMEVPFPDRVQPAMTAPWGDVASAWYTTGIGNIEVYMATLPGQITQLRRLRWMFPVLGFAPLRAVLGRLIRRHVVGPGHEQRQSGRSSFWGRVRDAEGNSAEATLQTPNGYRLTVATALASLERTLQGTAPAGFTTPAEAFGADFILSIPETDFRWC